MAQTRPGAFLACLEARAHRRGWSAASGGRGAAPNPGTASERGEEGARSGWAGPLLTVRTSPARRRAAPRKGTPEGTPPLRSGPTTWQPRGARREVRITPARVACVQLKTRPTSVTTRHHAVPDCPFVVSDQETADQHHDPTRLSGIAIYRHLTPTKFEKILAGRHVRPSNSD
jgi:hypothetical protein